MKWNDPEDRARLLEAVGVEEYNRQAEKERVRTIAAWANGYPIRAVSTPFGRLFAVEGTPVAFGRLDQAVRHCEGLPAKDLDPRYERVSCPKCGREFQRFDFAGNPHAFLCDGAKAEPLEVLPGETPR
jgi:hypothetical protein